MRPEVTYTPCVTSEREQSGDVIKFTQFKEGNIRTKLVTMQKTVTNRMTNQLRP